MSTNTDGVCCEACGQRMEDWSLEDRSLGLVCRRCGYSRMPVARPLDPPAPTVPQLLHRTVVARLTAERDAAREELEAVEAQMEPLARSMIYKGNSVDHWWAKAHAYKGIVHAVCEAFRALGYGGEMGGLDTLPKRLGTFAESLLGQRRDLEVALDQRKREVDAARLEAGALRERIEAAYRAMEAANEMVPRGPAGDTLAAKITALVAILRTAHAERAELRALVAADTKKMLEMMDR